MPRIGSFVQGLYRDESPATGEITKALCAAVLEYLPVELDEEGFKHGRKYRYASIHSIRRSIIAANCKHGLFINSVYGETDKGEFITTVLRHISGEYMASTSPVRHVDDFQDHKAGKTTLCRTHVEHLLGIATERDDDGASVVAATAVDAEQAKRWESTLALAVESIAKAKDSAEIVKFTNIARKRVETGMLAPNAMQAINEACKVRMSQLKEDGGADNQGTTGTEVADAAGGGSGTPDRASAGRAAGTGRGHVRAGG